MNVDKLIADLKDLENDEYAEHVRKESIFSTSEIKNKRNEINSCSNVLSLYNEQISYISNFNIKNEYRKSKIRAEKIQMNVLYDLIFLLKLKKKTSKVGDDNITKNIIYKIWDCIEITFHNENDKIEKICDENNLYIYKKHLLKNKFLLLKIIRKIKNNHLYPDIKQLIKDVTRDVFAFNGNIYNGSIGFENIIYLLYKLLKKKYITCPLKSFILSFFLLSIMSRTNNSVDILYILEYFYKNNNFSIIISDSSFLSPCELSIYDNIILLKNNIRYLINITEESTLKYNCYNIIYIDINKITDNFYNHIYKILLQQEKYHYIFKYKIFHNIQFFNTTLNVKKLNLTYNNNNNNNDHHDDDETFPYMNNTSKEHKHDKNIYNLSINNNSNELDDNIFSSDSSSNSNHNNIDIHKINEKNFLYINKNSKSQVKNIFYQYLIIELDEGK
ncbi:conserved Plasmodium protein, unknown function [Plasmodium sp. gorilla clade G2]|uniref:conserved Plasmodium protein, unknown function n=1 Tax=Plasmodium sp. gorilla clade G2 TaxID=880535 RepID=UPI000D21F9D7|nr:conserved Plasmodium protein, unknown function [Plasmodium sp. gorilla clade G2]SOV14238.1 conserved Plasmodium protein, unknown function [Plasmodium sp. gorilla clade G2]